jgi:hypothetical protein
LNKPKTKISLIASVLAIIVLLVFVLRPGKEKNETLVELNASVTFDGERFSVSNNDTIDYLKAEMTVNGYYKITGMNIRAGETYTFWPVEFAHVNRTRLPAKQTPQQFSIWCELNDGKNGFYSRKFK